MDLSGMRVALLEGRKADQLVAWVRRFGGEPYCVPAVRRQPRACAEEVLSLLTQLERETSPVIVFSSGLGVSALFNEAKKADRLIELKEALQRATTVCRGSKPAAALKREGLEASIRVKGPYTTWELLAALEPLPIKERFVFLLHYGERNLLLAESLLGRCAGLQELLLNSWALPEDTLPLHKLVRELIACRVGAIAFTSQVQARHLFSVAADAGLRSELISALHSHALVAAVGPNSASALESLGISPHVVPEHPKMGAMIESLARYVSQQKGAA
jgi:uroporphyrinogen-III synthase